MTALHVPCPYVLMESGQIVGMDIGNDFIQAEVSVGAVDKFAELQVAGNGIAFQPPGICRTPFDGKAKGFVFVEQGLQCLTLVPAFAQQAESQQGYYHQDEDSAQKRTENDRIVISFRKGDIHHCVCCRDVLKRNPVLLQRMPVQHILLGTLRHRSLGRLPFKAFLDAVCHIPYLAFQRSEISAYHVVHKAKALIDGLKGGPLEERGNPLGGIVAFGIKQHRVFAASQPHQAAHIHRVAHHAHNHRGIQQYVYVLPLQDGTDSFPFTHAVIRKTGKVGAFVGGHDVETLPLALFLQCLPYLAVQKGQTVHQADARLTHDALYHADGT